MIATSLAPRAYRRTVATSEIDDLVALYSSVRALSTTMTFASGVAAMIEAMLQAPDFLYRVELGSAVAGNTAVKRVAGREMATRLSYLFWQTMPDATLFQAADAGTLDTQRRRQAAGAEAARRSEVPSDGGVLLRQPAADPGPVRPDARRDHVPEVVVEHRRRDAVGGAARSRVRDLREHDAGRGAVRARKLAGDPDRALHVREPDAVLVLRSSTFASGTNAVTGTTLTKVSLNTSQRLGLLTLGGMAAGSTISDQHQPGAPRQLHREQADVPQHRAAGGVQHRWRPIPTAARRRGSAIRSTPRRPSARTATSIIDPLGFPFENYDAVGQYRATERWTDPTTNTTYDTPIDASGSVPGRERDGEERGRAGPAARHLAGGRELLRVALDAIRLRAVARPTPTAATSSRSSTRSRTRGYNVKQLLLALTQSDGFLYRPAQ